ncbi:MAG: hypothetical protein FD181_921 [Prolixibacteraceae bacterium]|nr:MAG: hypothetical protein FD181_921 [Prolixibacteraceae bacterium]
MPLKKRSCVYLRPHQKHDILISFGTKYWFLILLAAVIAALGIALLLYFRNKENNELSKTRVRFLMSLRFCSFFIIAFLLLQPFVKNLKKITRNPVIIAAWDNSSSIVSTSDSLNIATEIDYIREKIKSGLSPAYSLVEYSFGQKTRLLEGFSFEEKRTDYSELINTVANNHFNENIGALILIGDGIYNQGKNPLNMIKDISFPVYTIGLGDTTKIVDSRVQDIRVNRTSFAGNKFTVEADVRFSKLKGKTARISVIHENQEIASVVVTPPNENYFYTHQFILDAGQAGLKHFTVKTEIVENERNTKNNQAGFVINVLDKKQKILILSDGPHPDIGAIKNTLNLQTTYDVSVFTEEPFPANLAEFNLLILNQLPTSGKSAADIVANAQKSRIPILFVVGNKTFLPQLNALAQGTVITPLAGSGEEAQAILNTGYVIFNLSGDFREMLPRFPPLQVPFAEYELQPGFTPLFYQKIMNTETVRPLLATGAINGRKTGFIFGEGIWRWRLFNFYVNQNHALFNELINQLVQYLALRQNEDNFIIDFKPVYAETDEIIFNGEVYNDLFERINTQEVNLKIQSATGEEFDYTFDVQGNDYILNAGHLPEGDYTFTAGVELGGNTLTETGKFAITPVNLENLDLQANHNLLFQLAAESGGKFYLPNQSEQMVSGLKNSNRLKASSYFQEMINELLNLKWVFFVALLLLSVEWFLRKFWGLY